VANYWSADVLYHNLGNGAFEEWTPGGVDVRDNGRSRPLAWGDYDGDGDPDLFVGRDTPNCDLLFRNNGDSTFTDVTGTTTFYARTRRTITAAWFDYDLDGLLDVYVGHNENLVCNTGQQFTANSLYRNKGGGVFEDVISATGGDGRNTYALVPVDFDNDGDIDLFLGSDGATGGGGAGCSGTDVLHKNNGDGTFTDITTSAGVGGGENGDDVNTYGGSSADINGDGNMARRSSAEHLIATKALRCTATAWMLIVVAKF